MVNKFHQNCICPIKTNLKNYNTTNNHDNIGRMYAISTYSPSAGLRFKVNSCEILKQIPKITRIKTSLGDIFNAREKSLQTVCCLLLL